MDRTERFYHIDRLLRARRAVPRDLFLDELGVSLATFKRDLEYLRDRFHAPLVYDAELGGYRYDLSDPEAAGWALPGLWFNASEVHALLTMEQLLQGIQPGFLAPHLEPLLARVRGLLGSGEHAADEVRRRIKVIGLGARPLGGEPFGTLSAALLERRRLRIEHHSRERGETLAREISPQRMVHYRDNWYLDAWCHLRCALRSFAVDSIREAEALEAAAREVSEPELDAELGSGYGIFAGVSTNIARLRFTPTRARWVADEHWHSRQLGTWDAQGHYLLEVPYSDTRELVMDLLRHGVEVEVLEPESLRAEVAEHHRRAAARYSAPPGP